MSTHLREPGGHGGLRFHADCPVCRRERLAGAIPSEPVVSRRAQAVLAAGVLAVSAATPAATAAEPDLQREGTAAADRSEGQEPSFDPGGATTELSPDPARLPQVKAPADPGDDDTAPLDVEPLSEVFAQERGGTETPPRSTPTERATPRVAPTPTAAPVTTLGTGLADAPRMPRRSPKAGKGKQRGNARLRERVPRLLRPLRLSSYSAPPAAVTPGVAAVTEASAAPHLAPTQSSPMQAVLAAQPATGGSSQPSQSGGEELDRTSRFHVVQSGETLWSIARQLLEPWASVAQIGREVNRLWELNKDRIGTGDPDLLRVRTKLRLR